MKMIRKKKLEFKRKEKGKKSQLSKSTLKS
jgi:hypothetical protein